MAGYRASLADAQVLANAGEPAALWLSEALSDLIFLVLFLVYPSCIAKSYSAFQCIPLPEVERSYLRADLAIDCDGATHQAIMWGLSLIHI